MATFLPNMSIFHLFQEFCCPITFSPSLLLALTSIWFLLHRFVSPLLPLVFLPPAARAVHREKWRRWKQLHVIQEQWEKRNNIPTYCNTVFQKCLHPQRNLYERNRSLQDFPPLKPLQEASCGKLQSEKQMVQLANGEGDERIRENPLRRDSTEWNQEQHFKEEMLQETSRTSGLPLETTKNACANDQTWTFLSRDDARDAAIDAQHNREEEEGLLRKRFVASTSGKAAEVQLTAGSKKKDVYALEEKSLVMSGNSSSKEDTERKLSAKDVETSLVVEEHFFTEETGIAAVAGHLAAAAEEGAAAVAREHAEEAAAGEAKETYAEDKQKDDVDGIRAERQLLQNYFVMANANVIGMLHALYLTPAALYYSIRNVVLPAAELVLAERAAASTAKPVGHSHSDHAAARAADVLENGQVSSHHHVYDLVNTYLLHWEKAPSFWDGSSDCVVIFSAYMMTSYFVWDTFDCFKHYEVHGRAFFFHALLSLLAGILQVSARGIRLAGLCSMFAVSEISTPFLHFRWFLIQNGLGSSRLCTITTLWTVLLFILVRALMVPCLVFSHYWSDLLLYHKYTLREDAKISVVRALFMLALTVAWTALNLFWCFLFFRTLGRRRSRISRLAGSKKNLLSPQNCHRQSNSQQTSRLDCAEKTRSAVL